MFNGGLRLQSVALCVAFLLAYEEGTRFFGALALRCCVCGEFCAVAKRHLVDCGLLQAGAALAGCEQIRAFCLGEVGLSLGSLTFPKNRALLGRGLLLRDLEDGSILGGLGGSLSCAGGYRFEFCRTKG